jgi:hypothetical protein
MCLGIMCVPAELKQAVSVTAKYQSKYVEYANKKIQENPDEMAEEMVGIGERLDRNIKKLDKYFNEESD